MSDLFNFSLSDMMLFSSETFVRMITLHNNNLWPLHIVSIVVTLGLLWAVLRSRYVTAMWPRLAYAALAVAWIWVGYAFHLESYAPINWGAKVFAWAFMAQGALLLITALAVDADKLFAASGWPTALGRFLFVFGAIVWPVASMAAANDWEAAHLLGLLPDPTALATLGILFLAKGPGKYLLGLIPIAWCAISATTYVAMRLV